MRIMLVLVALVAMLVVAAPVSAKVKNVKKSLISAITKHPKKYYVNVHTGDFPAGAIRGQLHKPS